MSSENRGKSSFRSKECKTSTCNPAEIPRQKSLPLDPIHTPSGSKIMKKSLHFVAELYP